MALQRYVNVVATRFGTTGKFLQVRFKFENLALVQVGREKP